MTDVVSPMAPSSMDNDHNNTHSSIAIASQPRPIPPRKAPLTHLVSPVNQNGSFDFDRVLKMGKVSKRSRRTRSWKSFHLVLRPNLLSIYKNESESKLHKQINLSDLTAVAALKDPKGRRNYMFGLFSPARNYHFQAHNADEARSWVELISREAHLDEEEDAMIVGSPIGDDARADIRSSRMSTSSPEPGELSTSPYRTRDGVSVPGVSRTSFQENEYSGAEHASYSDFSDTNLPGSNAAGQAMSSSPAPTGAITSMRPRPIRTLSQNAPDKARDNDEERVIWHGHLLALKSKGGVRQWRKVWVVVRRKHVALYKSEEEYAAVLIIPMSNMVDAVEIDPISRSKAHCLQIISESKSYRFCARDEKALLQCLGALKSQLARRKERDVAKRADPHEYEAR